MTSHIADGGVLYDDYVAEIKLRNWATIGLAVILGGLGLVVWGQNPWSGMMYLIVATTQLLIGLGLLYRMGRRTDTTRAARVAVQHSWGVLSIGIAAAALFTSEFFVVDTIWLVIAVFVGMLWAAVGVFNLYWTVQHTDARLTV